MSEKNDRGFDLNLQDMQLGELYDHPRREVDMIADAKAIAEDFDRDVWCVLGLPLDRTTVLGSMEQIQLVLDEKRKCVMATPNLQWFQVSQDNRKFWNQIVQSDYSCLDGMPLLWMAKGLGIPLEEKVAGSTIFDTLVKTSDSPARIFFLGGDMGVARSAHESINAKMGDITSVGYFNPGQVSLDALTDESVIERINNAKPDILLVALGLETSVAWIERNKDKLQVPLIAYVGAVFNFLAGKVERAPSWVQKWGVEWLWRLKEEPRLFSRYYVGGVRLIWFVASRFIWHKRHLVKLRKKLMSANLFLQETENDKRIVLRIKGCADRHTRRAFKECFKKIALANKDIRIDMSGVTYVDNSFLGLLLLLHKHQHRRRLELELANVTPDIKKLFYYNVLEHLIR